MTIDQELVRKATTYAVDYVEERSVPPAPPVILTLLALRDEIERRIDAEGV